MLMNLLLHLLLWVSLECVYSRSHTHRLAEAGALQATRGRHLGAASVSRAALKHRAAAPASLHVHQRLQGLQAPTKQRRSVFWACLAWSGRLAELLALRSESVRVAGDAQLH